MVKVKVYSAFDVPEDVPQVFVGPSLTRQEFIDHGNVNKIVETFTRTGFMPDFGTAVEYADVSQVPDFQTAQNYIIAGRRAYEALPAKVKKRLKSPAELLEFLSNPENLDEAVKLGLVELKPDPATTLAGKAPEAPVAAPAKPASSDTRGSGA